MGATTARHTAALVVLSPGPQQGHYLPVPVGTSVVGRAEDCDVRLDDPTVSRRHALLRHDGAGLTVEDLGSRSGTTMDGQVVSGPVELRVGTEVSFASVTVRLMAPVAGAHDRTAGPPRPRARARYDVGSQHAETISNVGNDQYVSYVQHVVQQRESFLAQVAGMRSRARWLVWVGLLVALVGFALFAQYVLTFLTYVFEAIQAEEPPDRFQLPPSTDVGGIPTFVIGFALNAVGSVLVVVGIVQHVVASARARHVDRDLPLPPPGPPPGTPY